MSERLQSPIRVAVFNDIQSHLELMATILAGEADIEAVACGTCVEDVLEVAHASPIDVFLINWSLPVGGAISALEKLRAEYPSTRAILWSSWISLSNPHFTTILQAQSAGFDAIVDMPWRKREIVRAIRQVNAGDGFRRIRRREAIPGFSPLVQVIGSLTHRTGTIRELILAGHGQVWLVDSSEKAPDPVSPHEAADHSIFATREACRWAAHRRILPKDCWPRSLCFLDDPDSPASPETPKGSYPRLYPFTPAGLKAAIDLVTLRMPEVSPSSISRTLTPHTSGSTARMQPGRSHAVNCRDQVLAAAIALVRATATNEFTLERLVQAVRDSGSLYKDSTIRTHITSRMCVNAPKHHGVSYPDFVRTARGHYRLSDQPISG